MLFAVPHFLIVNASLFTCHSPGIFLLTGDGARRLKGFLLNGRKRDETATHAALC
jgi:hypothetical protein